MHFFSFSTQRPPLFHFHNIVSFFFFFRRPFKNSKTPPQKKRVWLRFVFCFSAFRFTLTSRPFFSLRRPAHTHSCAPPLAPAPLTRFARGEGQKNDNQQPARVSTPRRRRPWSRPPFFLFFFGHPHTLPFFFCVGRVRTAGTDFFVRFFCKNQKKEKIKNTPTLVLLSSPCPS